MDQDITIFSEENFYSVSTEGIIVQNQGIRKMEYHRYKQNY